VKIDDVNLSAEQLQFWKYILSVSESMTKDAESGSIKRADLMQYLESIEETFKKSADPVEQFQRFVLLEFSRAVRCSVEKI